MKSNRQVLNEAKSLLNASLEKSDHPVTNNKSNKCHSGFVFGKNGSRNIYFSIFNNLNFAETYTINRVSKKINKMNKDYINYKITPNWLFYFKNKLSLYQDKKYLSRHRFGSILERDIDIIFGDTNKNDITAYFGYKPVFKLKNVKFLPDNVNLMLLDLPIDMRASSFLYNNYDQNTRLIYSTIRLGMEVFYSPEDAHRELDSQIFDTFLNLVGDDKIKMIHAKFVEIVNSVKKLLIQYKKSDKWFNVEIWNCKTAKFISQQVKNDEEAREIFNKNADMVYPDRVGLDIKHPLELKFYFPYRELYNEFNNLLGIFNETLELIENHTPKLKESGCRCIVM